MEKIRRNVEDKATAEALEFIEQNALGNPIILPNVPKKADVKANNFAVNGTDVYLRTADGKLLKITTTEIT